MFKELGVLWVDHVAVTTRSFAETADHYLSMPNARILRGPGWNSSQKVNYLFVSFGGDMCIEILGLPEQGSSPIGSHVAMGGGAYHLCYVVENLDYAIEHAQNIGIRLVSSPKPDDAYDGRRVAFLMHPAHGLFELLEARMSPAAYTTDTNQTDLPVDEPHELGQVIDDKNEKILIVTNAFNKVFSSKLPNNLQDWDSEHINGWDSLSHLRLIMEIERSLDVSIPSSELHKLLSLDVILKYLKLSK